MKLPSKSSQAKSIQEIKNYLKVLNGFYKNPPPEYKYTPSSFLLKYGKGYFINEKTFEGKRAPAKMCFQNATKLALSNSKYTYVEGYVDISIMPIEHAWVIDQQGNVIDNTLVYKEGPINPVGYFGIPVSTETLSKMILGKKTYGLLHYDNRDIYKQDFQG